MITIGDVHGRKFWRDAVSKRLPGEPVVFVGDYLDPYSNEGVTDEDAYNEFVDIIEYARNNPDTILLLGNHDFGIIDDDLLYCRSRFDFVNKKRNRKTFKDNFDLFRLAYQIEINGISYLVTHAGVQPEWYSKVCESFPKNADENIAGHLNRIYLKGSKTLNKKFYPLLMNVSRYRSKWSRIYYGSCIWSDFHEWFNSDSEDLPGVRQIFGHTRSDEEYISDEISMIDNMHGAFRVTYDNKMIKL